MGKKEPKVDEYILEFVERMNQPDSFPDRRVARHLSEIFNSWLDLSLVVVQINDEPELYNATRTEYEAFIEACTVANSGSDLLSLLSSLKKEQRERQTHDCSLVLHKSIWKQMQESNPQLGTGAVIRLVGLDSREESAIRHLYYYYNVKADQRVAICLYSLEKCSEEQLKQIAAFCDATFDHLTGQSIQLRITKSQKHLQTVYEEPSEYFNEPKILFKYLEASAWNVIRQIRETLGGDDVIKEFARANGEHQQFYEEFVFVLNVARRMDNAIPNDIGYHLTYSQIKRIREVNKKEGNKGNADLEIDALQNERFVTLDVNGVPNERYSISSYVMRVEQTEYVDNVREDPRLDSEKVSYPEAVRKVEDKYVHARCLLMVPIFVNVKIGQKIVQKIGAMFWMSSNTPIEPETRFRVLSTVRRYEYLIANAILMEWVIVRPLLTETSLASVVEWSKILEGLAEHELRPIRSILDSEGKSKVAHVIKIVRAMGRPGMALDETDTFLLLAEVRRWIEEKDFSHVNFQIEIDPTLELTTSKFFLREAFLQLIGNSATQIILDGQSGAKGIIKITASSIKTGTVHIELWDSGEPFPAANRHTVFTNPQVESTHGGNGKGCGIATSIFSRLGGKVSLAQDNKTIYIDIPQFSRGG